MSAAVTTLSFDGSQYFRMSASVVARDMTTYNMSLRIRTNQSECHLMTMTSSVNDARLQLFVDGGHVKIKLPTPSQPLSSTRISSVVSATILFLAHSMS